VSTNPLAPANLTVVQQASQDFTAPTETLRFVITVTNSGPGAASNVLLAIKPPASVASLTPQVPQGSVTNLSGNFLCNLGSLPAGQSLAVILSAVITNTSSYTNFGRGARSRAGREHFLVEHPGFVFPAPGQF
jgi:uncharacterized repeat protein (TIGR01451 family)